MIYMLGQQNDPLGLVAGQTQPIIAEPYNELILLIPYTVHSPGSNRWHNYAARM